MDAPDTVPPHIPVPEFTELRKLATLCDLPASHAMAFAAHLVDGAAYAESEEDLNHALELINELRESSIDKEQALELQYYMANVWHALRLIRYPTVSESWAWRQPEMENELLLLRGVANSTHFPFLIPGRQTQVLTNTGNLLNIIGRSLEAIRLYDEALAAFPGFGMATLNKGIALLRLADLHYDSGQATLLAHAAYQALKSTRRDHLEPGTERALDRHVARLESVLPMDFLQSEPFPNEGLSGSPEEQAFRR